MKAFLLALVILAGCGDSPLLNHSDLDDRPGRTLGLLSLSFTKLDLPFEMQWSNKCPNLTDGCSYDLVFSKTIPLGSALSAELWMPSMGHGSSPVEIQQVGPLHWLVSEAYFIMSGHWQVKMKLTLPNGTFDEVVVNHNL